jgi:hypothetical protein
MIAISLFAQTGNPVLNLVLSRKAQYATVLNGSTQYWSKTSPVNMDLNGAELLTNGAMEGVYTAGVANGWVKSLNTGYAGTYTKDSTAYNIHGGTYSQRIVMSSSKFEIKQGGLSWTGNNKATQEAWIYASVADTFQLGFWDGTSNFNSSTLPVVAKTWTKLVYNSQPTHTAAADSFYIRQLWPKTDTVRIDDVSLTQAYDAMIIVIEKTTMNGDAGLVFHSNNFGSAASNIGWALINRITSRLDIDVNDGTTRFANVQTVSYFDGGYHVVIATIDRTGNSTIYFDGTSVGTLSISTCGKIISPDGLFVGKAGTSGGAQLTGNCSQVQVIRFTGIGNQSSNISMISANKNKPFPSSYTNSQIVFWTDWSRQGYDKSGTGNTLSPTASPSIQKVKY